MRRRLSIMLAALSLALCVAAIALWARSERLEDHVGMSLARGRFTVRSWQGRLTLWGPPPAGSPSMEKLLDDLAIQLRNDQISWRTMVVVTDSDRAVVAPYAYPNVGTPAYKIVELATTPANRSLLKALDDPNRVAAAHCVLSYLSEGIRIRPSAYPPMRLRAAGINPTTALLPPPTPLRLVPNTGVHLVGDPVLVPRKTGRVPPHSIVVDYNGLRIDLWPEGAVANYSSYPTPLRDPGGGSAVPPRIDADSAAAVRDSWHRQLDAQVFAVPLKWLVLATVLIPIVVFTRVARDRLAARRGLCPICHYDLRASTERCPECARGSH